MRDLFGLELPTAVTFAIAFVVVLLLIGVLAWAVRRFGATRMEAARSRQPRLAVVDSAAVDNRRKLVIVSAHPTGRAHENALVLLGYQRKLTALFEHFGMGG